MVKKILAGALLTMLATSSAGAVDIKLPPPQLDMATAGIFQLLNKRISALPPDNLGAQGISTQDISNLLWAASGLNRPGRGWVIPIASGSAPAPYWRVYAVMENGIFLYNWRSHELMQTSRADVRNIMFVQNFSPTPPLIIVFVEDKYIIDDVNTVTNNRYASIDIGAMAVGGMCQNVYLASEALNMATRFMLYLKFAEINKALDLSEDDKVIGAMPIWPKAIAER